MEDYAIPIREAAALECSFKEITPAMMAMAHGIDPYNNTASLTASYTSNTSGEVALGGRTAPAYVRMEAIYTYPNGTRRMIIIFPKAQVTSAVEMDLPTEDWAAVPITFESKNCSSDALGGHVQWDSYPLGVIRWDNAGTSVPLSSLTYFKWEILHGTGEDGLQSSWAVALLAERPYNCGVVSAERRLASASIHSAKLLTLPQVWC